MLVGLGIGMADGPKEARAAGLLVEVNSRRVPVRVYDEHLETAPPPPM